MKVVKFKECNFIYAQDQTQYIPLHCHKTKDGIATSCWSFNFHERLIVLFRGHIFLKILTFNKLLMPLLLTTKKGKL